MPLERIFIHHLIRVLRVATPILVAVLIAIPAWNYISRRVQKSLPAQAQELPANLAIFNRGVTFSRTEGGRTLFTVRARTNSGFKDSKGMLEDVDVTVYGSSEKESTVTVRSKYCSYDEKTNDFRFEGNVEVQLDDNTQVRSEELTFNYRDQIISSSKQSAVEQPGSMTGQANSLDYSLKTGLLKLVGDVKVRTADNASLEAASALFHRNENWATAAGGVFLKSRTGWIRGTTGRADLEPATFKPTTILIEGDVTAESQAQAGNELWKLRAGWLEAAIAATGNPERMNARRSVELEKVSSDNGQRLSGEEVDATLDAAGKVDLLDARQNAVMILGSNQTLRSTQIRSTAAGSVETADRSILQMGDSVIEGSQFTIQSGDIVTFTTTRRANLRSGGQQTSADQTEATFDSRSNRLLGLVQTGNFRFQDSQLEGYAHKARFEEGGSVVRLEGSPVVSTPEMRLQADEIRLNQSDNSFTAERNVKTVTRNSGEQAVVTANRGQRTGDNFLYTGNVQLWRGNAYIKADRLEVSSKDNRLHAEGGVQSNLEGIRAVSDKLDYDDTRNIARYTGKVRAQKQAMVIQASDVTVKLREKEKDLEEIVAVGGVLVTRGQQRGTGEQAVYDARTEFVTLTGKNAEVYDKEQGTVRGARLIMKTTGNEMSVEGGDGGRVVSKSTVRK